MLVRIVRSEPEKSAESAEPERKAESIALAAVGVAVQVRESTARHL